MAAGVTCRPSVFVAVDWLEPKVALVGQRFVLAFGEEDVPRVVGNLRRPIGVHVFTIHNMNLATWVAKNHSPLEEFMYFLCPAW